MWTKEDRRFGIAIFNFKKEDIPYAIDLKVCDKVVILEKCQGWYRGYVVDSPEVKGIFPSNYVHLTKVFRSGEDLVDEVVETLKEWNKALRNHFVDCSQDAADIQMTSAAIKEETPRLLQLRNNLMSPYLTVKEQDMTRAEMANKLDWGNRRLKLHLVPRINGMQVEPFSVCAAELYKIHEQSTRRSSGLLGNQKSMKSSACMLCHVHIKLCSVIINDISDAVHIFFSLYDASNSRYITERALCQTEKGYQVFENDNEFTAMFMELSAEDLGENSYVIAHIYREGSLNKKPSKGTVLYKRPHGCAVLKLTDILKDSHTTSDQENSNRSYYMPVMVTKNHDGDDFSNLLDSLVKSRGKKEVQLNDQIVIEATKVFGDVATVRKFHPQLFTRTLNITQKLGFADLLAPDEIRNDFYLNLREGNFEKSGKSAEKNIEARILVFDRHGNPMQYSIHGASGDEPRSQYNSAVFYHSNSPKWNEVVKITLNHKSFRECHIRLEFRHCSTKSAEKKLIGIAYFPLEDRGGMTMKDGKHELLIYKPQQNEKKATTSYVNLPFDKDFLNGTPSTDSNFILSPKESCIVDTTLCSTKLTQDVNLLNLLKWQEILANSERRRSQSSQNVLTLEHVLRNIILIQGDELMRHHTDFMSCLFEITCKPNTPESNKYEPLIFEALIHMLKFTTKKNFELFQPLVDRYITKSFSYPKVYDILLNQICRVLRSEIQGSSSGIAPDLVAVLHIIFKFLIKAASFKNRDQDDLFCEPFWVCVIDLMSVNRPNIKQLQLSLAERLIDLFPLLIGVMHPMSLADCYRQVINKMNKRDSETGTHKLFCLSKAVGSVLFEYEDARSILLEVTCSQLKLSLLNTQDLDRAVQTLCDLLIRINRMKCVQDQKEVVISELYNVVCETIHTQMLEQPVPHATACTELLITCYVTMMSMLDEALFSKVWNEEVNEKDLVTYTKKSLSVLTFCYKTVPQDWIQLTLVHNRFILSTTSFYCNILLAKYLKEEKYNPEVWKEFLMMAANFILQPSLQLEKYSETRQENLKTFYGNMRLKMADHLVFMWEALGPKHADFMSCMVELLIEIVVIPDEMLRAKVIPLFYDMLACEFNDKKNFNGIKREIIRELDSKFRDGKGDIGFSRLFEQKMSEKLNVVPGMKDDVKDFTSAVVLLINRLLDYRKIDKDQKENIHTLMLSLVDLMYFYEKEIPCPELYTLYISTLCELQVRCEQFTEAGLTLLLNANKFNWTDNLIKLKHNGSPEVEWQVKESYLQKVVQYLDKGQMWEKAIPICRELATFYETKLIDFTKLGEILDRQSSMYKQILAQRRLDPTYFRVAFYGQLFPLCLRNKSFIFRAGPWEKLGDVIRKLEMEYPNATVLNPSVEPDDTMKGQLKQVYQVFAVRPVEDDKSVYPEAIKPVSFQISQFYKQNNIQKFVFDLSFHKGTKDKSNEFKTLHMTRITYKTMKPLPDIVCWMEIESKEEYQLPPILCAIDSLTRKNEENKETFERYKAKSDSQINQLSMTLNGTIDASVGGGLAKYQEAFLTAEYLLEHPSDVENIKKLKATCIEMLEVLKDGLQLFGDLVTADLRPLYDALCQKFAKLCEDVNEAVGPGFKRVSYRSGESSSTSCPSNVAEPVTGASPRNSSGFPSSENIKKLRNMAVNPNRGSINSVSSEGDNAFGEENGEAAKMGKSSLNMKSDKGSNFYSEVDSPSPSPRTPLPPTIPEAIANRPLPDTPREDCGQSPNHRPRPPARTCTVREENTEEPPPQLPPRNRSMSVDMTAVGPLLPPSRKNK